MKRISFILIISLMVITIPCHAFDWKPQTNEALRSDMIAFARDFAQEAKGTKAGRMLKRFVRRQERLAKTDEYAWMRETHEIVEKLKGMYPPKVDDGQFEAMMRRRTLQLLDYPLHFDNFAKTSPEGTDAFNSVTEKYLGDARQKILTWLDTPKPAAGKLDVALIYNMGVLLRTSEHVIGIDLRWDGSKDEAMRIAESIDALFLTHPHSDHYSPVMLQAAIQAGKPVVLPCRLKSWDSEKALIIDKDCLEGKPLGDLKVRVLRGDQGENIPNNIYLIEMDGWRILHQGDNEVWDIQKKLEDLPMAEVIIAPSWNGMQALLEPAMKGKKLRGDRPLLLPLHNNEMAHSVNHRESYHELFNRKDRLGNSTFQHPPYVLIDNGEHYVCQH